MTEKPRGDAPNRRSEAEDISAEHRALARERGYDFPTFAWLGIEDPEFERARIAYVRMTYQRPDNELPAKYKELIASAILAFRGYPSLKHHLARALREGATLREVLEAMEVASVPGGMATLHFAVDALIEVEQEHPELFADRPSAE